MSEIAVSSISKIARTFNYLPSKNTIQGMKTAAALNRKILEAEKEQENSKINHMQEEMPVPTGEEIRKAREEGEYR